MPISRTWENGVGFVALFVKTGYIRTSGRCSEKFRENLQYAIISVKFYEQYKRETVKCVIMKVVNF